MPAHPTTPLRSLALLFASLLPTAGNASDWFAEAAAGYSTVEIGGETFHPQLLRLQGGWYFYEGIAIAVQVAGAISDDRVLGLDAEIESLASWFLRFETPESDGFRLSLQGGYSETRLSLRNAAGNPGVETFTSPSLGAAIAQRLGQSPWSLTLDYYRHYQQDGVDIRTINLGLQYDF